MPATGTPALIVVFAKSPEPGRVKTRLVPALRAREASDLYRAMLLDTLDVVQSCGEVVVAYESTAGRRLLEQLVGRRARLVPQPAGDLGTKLAGVTKRLLDDGRRPLIALGSDCPGVDSDLIREALRLLDDADLVIGPALDGGYYLIGLDRPRPGVFEEIPWSTAQVFDATLARATALRLRVATLRQERDLDTPSDLLAWYERSREHDLGERFPRTSRAIQTYLSPQRVSAIESELGSR